MIAPLIAQNSIETRSCDQHPIYCQIKSNKPSIDEEYAYRLSNIIYKVCEKYHIPPRIYTAILMQESGYTLTAKSKHHGMLEEPLNLSNTCSLRSYKYVTVYSDLGIAQIYVKTAQAFNMDFNRLLNDLEYSVECGAIILNNFRKRYERKEIDWWTRYNASSPRKRLMYKHFVEKYY